jgi:acyl-CoA thioesterase-2
VSVNAFAQLIDLSALGGDVFRAPPAPERSGRVYGGQFLAQGLAAASSTIDQDRDVHSLHAYFLRPGDVELPIELEVERLRDGRSFSARVVRAVQQDKELFRMMASFHVPEPGDDYAGARIPDAPAPETVPLTYNAFSRANGEGPDWDGESRPMDIRYINPPTAPPGQPVLEPQRMWVRIRDALGEAWSTHYAALAYLSDSTLIDHVVLPHGRRWQDPALNGASLDHAMWFHHRARADTWLLFDQHVVATGHGRGFAQGLLFDRSGRLVASCAQEGLIRWVGPPQSTKGQ